MTGIIVSQMSESLTCSHVWYGAKYQSGNNFRFYSRHYSPIFVNYLSYKHPLRGLLWLQKAKNFIKCQYLWQKRMKALHYREGCPHVLS